jgi:hypothetical protein
VHCSAVVSSAGHFTGAPLYLVELILEANPETCRFEQTTY